jgi:hypothetical protein|tara:strand:+ start:749 stop:931 length:183 start_codon:yes stop_codon:yes gene_type:complete
MKIFTGTPLISKEVLHYLEAQYPDRIPMDASMTAEDFRYLQGQQSVIEKIRQLTEFEEED